VHLHKALGCTVQMGGADQWGNITAGLELIRRTSGGGDEDADPAHGLAYKLLLSPSGTKFGKSDVGESVWLDPARTSPYAFYQYWLNTDDRDVGTYLRWFTELSRETIEALEAQAATAPEGRPAQRALARDITIRTHGVEAADRAIADSEAKFSATTLTDPATLASLFESAGGFTFAPSTVVEGAAVLLAEAGVFASRGEARRMIAGGGVTINGERVTDPAFVPEPIAGEWLDVRIGKRRREIGRQAG
jgi:tyrosyl-tRNA synthetase